MSDFASRMWETIKQERFLLQDPEQLWAMVESADGPTASGLGLLLTEAAKTIKEIGGNLRTHSMAVEWEGAGGEAFRTWCYQAALTTLSLGDYSENAGKWLGHAADTLHEVKPQIETLRNQSVSARSVLDTHAAKATDVGSHDGGPSDSAVTKAKTQYANSRAEAGGLMMKLAQSYTASTEQITALEAPKFPELPKQFVPTTFYGTTAVDVPTGHGTAAQGVATPRAGQDVATPERPSGHNATVGANSGGTSAAPPQPPVRHHAMDVPDVLPRHVPDATNTVIDSVKTLPSHPTIPSSPSTPPVGPSGPDGRTPSVTGPLPPSFGAGTTLPPGVQGGGERPVYGGQGPLATPSGADTSTGPRIPGRGLSDPFGPGVTGGQPGAGRGPINSPSARGVNGVIGGRAVSPSAGRSAGAIPQGTVIGGEQPPRGRGGVPGRPSVGATPARGASRTVEGEGAARGRMPSPSNGIIGGQPRPSRDRGRAGFTSRGVRPASEAAVDEQMPRGGGPTLGASKPATSRDDRSARDRRSGRRATDRAEGRDHQAVDRDDQAEERESRPAPPPLPKGPDGDIGREG